MENSRVPEEVKMEAAGQAGKHSPVIKGTSEQIVFEAFSQNSDLDRATEEEFGRWRNDGMDI